MYILTFMPIYTCLWEHWHQKADERLRQPSPIVQSGDFSDHHAVRPLYAGSVQRWGVSLGEQVHGT